MKSILCKLLCGLVPGLLALHSSVGWTAGTGEGGPPFPTKAVRIVSAYASGSGPDSVVRLVARQLSQKWQQPVRVENRPGGGGFVAINTVVQTPGDGYTLLQVDTEHLAALPLLHKDRPFEPLQKLQPVTSLFSTPLFLAVSSKSEWKSLSDLVAAAKAKPGAISYGSWGVGSAAHLGGALIESSTGADMVHLPYRSTNELYAAIGSGNVSWGFASLPSSEIAYEAGTLRYLAVTAERRVPQMPQVPTVREAGGPAGLNKEVIVGLAAPKGVPAAVVEKIHADVHAVLASAEMRETLDNYAYKPLGWSAADIERNAAERSREYKRLVGGADVRPY